MSPVLEMTSFRFCLLALRGLGDVAVARMNHEIGSADSHSYPPPLTWLWRPRRVISQAVLARQLLNNRGECRREIAHVFSPLIPPARLVRQLPKVSRATLILLLYFLGRPQRVFKGFVLDGVEQRVVFLGVMQGAHCGGDETPEVDTVGQQYDRLASWHAPEIPAGGEVHSVVEACSAMRRNLEL